MERTGRTRRGRNRKKYSPSSGHKLAALVLSQVPINRTPETVRRVLEESTNLSTVSNLAGVHGAEWVIARLSNAPHVAPGWPEPCKAARMSLAARKTVQR